MKKTFKFLPLTAIPYFLLLISIAVHLRFFNFSLDFFKGTIKGFVGIMALLFQFWYVNLD